MAITEFTKTWIRKQFIDQTGRFDLVVDTTDYADAGADFFIDSGNKILDMLMEHPKSIMRYQVDLAAGDHKVEMKRLRAVKLVEVTDGEARTPLTPRDYSWFREEYNKPVADMTRGTPTDYALIVNTLSPELKALTAATYSSQFTYDSEDIRFYDENIFLYDGIIFYPPADKVYTIIVHGLFFSHLEDDSDKNYYSVNHPNLLVLASKLALYSTYDNTQAVNDVLKSMDIIMGGVDRDVIASEMTRSGLVRKGY